MTTKEYLSQIHRLDTIISQKKNQLNELKILSNTIKSTDYSKEVVQSSKESLASFVVEIEKITLLEKEINSIIEVYLNKKNTIINEIQSLDDVNYIKILYQRYVDNKSFKEIAFELNYDYDYIRLLHQKSLSDFEKITQNNTN